MAVRQPRYSRKEFARRGDEIYESQIRQQVERGNQGKIVAIDIETGDFEVDKNEIAACDRLEARQPDAQVWIVRIGSVPSLFYRFRLSAARRGSRRSATDAMTLSHLEGNHGRSSKMGESAGFCCQVPADPALRC